MSLKLYKIKIEIQSQTPNKILHLIRDWATSTDSKEDDRGTELTVIGVDGWADTQTDVPLW